MRIDLFDFLEGLIRGFVYFFYSVLGTLWMLIAHPFRGPIRLYRGYLRTRKREAAGDRRQLSAITCLFLVYFVTLGWTGGIANADLNEPVAAIAKLGPTLDLAAIWVPVLGAMVITVALDAVLRLVLRLRYFRDARKRQLALPIIEYAMILPSIVIVAAPMIYLIWLIFSLHAMASVVATFVGWLVAGVLSCMPAAAILFPRPRRAVARWLFRPGAAFAGAVLAFGAGWAGLAAHDMVKTMREDDSISGLTVLSVRCHLLAEQPYVEFIVANESPAPVLVGGDDGFLPAHIILFDFDDKGEIVREVRYLATLEGDEGKRGILIRPKGYERLRLIPIGFDVAKMPERDECMPQGHGFGWTAKPGGPNHDSVR